MVAARNIGCVLEDKELKQAQSKVRSGASRAFGAKKGFKLNLGNMAKVNRLAIFEVVTKPVFIGFCRVL